MGTVLIKQCATAANISNLGRINVPQVNGWYGGADDSSAILLATQIRQFLSLLWIKPIGSVPDACTGSITLEFDQSTPIFELDGNPGISFNDLPAGFVFTSLVYTVHMSNGSSPAAVGTYTFELNPVVSPQNISAPNDSPIVPFTGSLISVGDTLTAQDFLDFRLIFSFSCSAVPGGTNQAAVGVGTDGVIAGPWLFEGTYELQQFKFNLDTEAPVEVGQETTISTQTKEEDLKTIDTVVIDYTTLDNVDHEIVIPAADFVTQTTNLLIFLMPDFGDAPKVEIFITGTQFTGRVPLGPLLTINFLDGTGIYKLDTSATHDTLYIQDYDPVQTIDVKIPNPFAKTAFVP